jgi:nitrite reductase/ring-hydroxylating ferredoxin subunit/DMSO/TMAO reductase YedYZ heme-binding membrane subunit
VVLCIGPLSRLDRRFLPLLYNRRHLGVATFLVALAHGTVVVGFYHGFGVWNPLISLLVSNTNYGSLQAFPFQVLGLTGLAILFLLAATSHDFWNRTLGARFWKCLHMLVYVAYGILVMHVALGAMQTRRGAALPLLVLGGAACVVTLHLVAGRREISRDREAPCSVSKSKTWVDVGCARDILDGRGRIVTVNGSERIALFRHAGGISAITNVCAHQGGPLGEGRIIDGCVTCPWHGWQYRPADGCAPPPFTERIATYRVRIENDRVMLDPEALAAGTYVEPARIAEDKNDPRSN